VYRYIHTNIFTYLNLCIGIVHRDLKPENLLYASHDPEDPGYEVLDHFFFQKSDFFFNLRLPRPQGPGIRGTSPFLFPKKTIFFCCTPPTSPRDPGYEVLVHFISFSNKRFFFLLYASHDPRDPGYEVLVHM
jgi:serine/threonine protein kinase